MCFIFVLIGLAICFFGNAFFQPLLFITGVAQASFVLMLICYSTFVKNNSEIWIGWVILIVSVGVGIGIGFVFIKYQKVGAFALAAWGGFSVGLLIYNAILYKVDSEIALWCFSIAMGLLYGFLVFRWSYHVLITASAFIGSFLTLFGIGLVAGHYPNPFILSELISHDQLDKIDPIFYAYFGATIVLFALGCVFQYHRFSKKQSLQKDLIASITDTAGNESNYKGKDIFKSHAFQD